MFCPGCSLHVNDDLKFCRHCGANLRGVRGAMESRSTGEKFDWSKTWWAEMIYSPEELERRRGITPEEKRLNEEKKRLNEIKGGVITSLVGIGVMISFYFFFGAVAKQAEDAAEIVRKLWMLGIIPTLVGAGLLINGFFISRRLVKLEEQLARAAMSPSQEPIWQPEVSPEDMPEALNAKTTDQLIVNAAPEALYSVTEDTTAHLLKPVAAPLRREND